MDVQSGKIKTFQNIDVPALGFGTFELTGKACVEGVSDALEIGYRHIDTAQMYRNEQEVGKAINASGIEREQIFLTTKIWYENLDEKKLLSSFDKSLNDLQLDYVDLLLIHWPSPDGYPLEKSINAMLKIKHSGKAKQIGVSNFTPSLLKASLAHSQMLTNQVEFHSYLDQTTLLELTRQNNMTLTAYCPLAKGKTVKDALLNEIGKRYGKSASQVALRWLIQHENVLAIPRSSNHKHRLSNFQIFDFELTDEEMRSIRQLDRSERLIDPVFAPAWER